MTDAEREPYEYEIGAEEIDVSSPRGQSATCYRRVDKDQVAEDQKDAHGHVRDFLSIDVELANCFLQPRSQHDELKRVRRLECSERLKGHSRGVVGGSRVSRAVGLCDVR